MTRAGLARRGGYAALTAAALYALPAVWIVRAPDHLLPGDAFLHRWSVEHRPAVASVPARALTRTGTEPSGTPSSCWPGCTRAAPAGSAPGRRPY
ncbi:hypothetical protein [Streptomyces sp. NPDC054838]